MFIEYCFFLFDLHTCKFCKIASINFVMVVYTEKKSWGALFETATWLIKLIVISLSEGRVVLLLPLQELSA